MPSSDRGAPVISSPSRSPPRSRIIVTRPRSLMPVQSPEFERASTDSCQGDHVPHGSACKRPCVLGNRQ
eukprot:scaffold4673_cov26-Tisochrysis_lutea.AAC.1